VVGTHRHHRRGPPLHALESGWRRVIQPVEPIIEILSKEVPERRAAVDFGAGTGYFTLPLAEVFEKVYAVDADPEALGVLRGKLESRGVTNVDVIQSDRLPDVEVDLIFLSNVLHELQDREAFVEDAARRTRYIMVVDWRREEAPYGPPLWERLSEEDAIRLLEGFFKVKRFNVYPYHYVLLGVRV
jgi:2-polyprenyl-3-methyl-5-hydroxy-6-metoxy-1,4-benzoquinol methylase